MSNVGVTRNSGGIKLEVPKTVLSGFHITTYAGGTGQTLPRPALAAFMSCDAIPDGSEFGHSCRHRAGPHRIKVLIQKVDNDRRAYADLRAKADLLRRAIEQKEES